MLFVVLYSLFMLLYSCAHGIDVVVVYYCVHCIVVVAACVVVCVEHAGLRVFVLLSCVAVGIYVIGVIIVVVAIVFMTIVVCCTPVLLVYHCVVDILIYIYTILYRE